MSEKENKTEYFVVSELPQAPMREVTGEDGKKYSLVPLNEAIKECLDILRDVKKAVVGN